MHEGIYNVGNALSVWCAHKKGCVTQSAWCAHEKATDRALDVLTKATPHRVRDVFKNATEYKATQRVHGMLTKTTQRVHDNAHKGYTVPDVLTKAT